MGFIRAAKAAAAWLSGCGRRFIPSSDVDVEASKVYQDSGVMQDEKLAGESSPTR